MIHRLKKLFKQHFGSKRDRENDMDLSSDDEIEFLGASSRPRLTEVEGVRLPERSLVLQNVPRLDGNIFNNTGTSVERYQNYEQQLRDFENGMRTWNDSANAYLGALEQTRIDTERQLARSQGNLRRQQDLEHALLIIRTTTNNFVRQRDSIMRNLQEQFDSAEAAKNALISDREVRRMLTLRRMGNSAFGTKRRRGRK
jgi:hypothetical protein